MALGLSARWLLHDQDDENDGHGSEDGGAAKGPVPVVEGVGEPSANNVAETAERKAKVVKKMILTNETRHQQLSSLF